MKLIQPGLFRYPLKQLCRLAKCEVKDLKFLRKKALLSFPLYKKGYEEYEVDEARFLTSLLKSGLPVKMIIKMLSSLEKPYSYTNIYYDFIKNKWLSLDDIESYVESEGFIAEENIEDYIKENIDLEEYFDDYIYQLAEEKDGDKLLEIREKISEYLE